MTRILVTGGAGMIGSNLVRRLVRSGARVDVVDDFSRGHPDNLREGDGRFVVDPDRAIHRLDLRVPGVLDPLLGDIDYVFHLADIVAGIGFVFSNERAIFRQNMLINSNVVASVAAVPKLRGYIYVGTACSFPAARQTGPDAPPLTEDELYPASPESAYGWSKLMGQYEAELMQKETGIPVALPILHNVYGTPSDLSRERSQVLPALVRRAVEWPQQPFTVWGSGSQGRAFVHVDDVIDGLVAAMTEGLGRGPIQLGPDICTTIREAAETVVRVSGKPIEIVYDPTKPEGDRGRCADYGKARTLLGWRPRVAFGDGMADLYRWAERRLAAAYA